MAFVNYSALSVPFNSVRLVITNLSLSEYFVIYNIINFKKISIKSINTK